MPVEVWIVGLAVGAVSGWLAGKIVTGSGLGLIGNIIVGILGSLVASYLFPRLEIHIGIGLGAHILNAAIGGVILLSGLSLLERIL